jgi:hypothetical protein
VWFRVGAVLGLAARSGHSSSVWRKPGRGVVVNRGGAEDRPTDFGAVKAGEMAGLAEIVLADRPLVADEMFGDVGAELPVAAIDIAVRTPLVSQTGNRYGR